MYYYEVLVGDLQFHGNNALTYASTIQLEVGCVVKVALRERPALGIVSRKVPQPKFEAKLLSSSPFPPLPLQSLQLLEWLRLYYPAPLGTITRQFLPPTTTFPPHTEQKAKLLDDKQNEPTSLPPLTRPQKDALSKIKDSGYHLLHGVTGSGKTRLYIELARRALSDNRSVIVLTPEIGLTAQLTGVFSAAFPGKVHVLHSRLTAAERRNIWYDLLAATSPVVVIGPRSALFTPIHNLGLIVMDESHDQAYKSDSAPHYRTERVAAQLAHLHTAVFLAGSATPNIDDYFVAQEKNLPIITMNELATISDAPKPDIVTVDLRDGSQFTRSRIITHPLYEAVQQALENGEQALLFLNRRGTANTILCSNCAWQALCEHCDLPLTYHADSHDMRCHVCARHWPLPRACPDCGHTDIIFKTIGTKAVIAEAQKLFASARIQRFDSDIAKGEQLENQLANLQAGEVDILIGTQIISKGLDLPKLSVVGVLNADSSLLIPDFTASERTYQLLTQVIGRVGRGHRKGRVIVQAYNPAHPTLVAALAKDWQTFYTNELHERNLFSFPPYTFLLHLTCARASSKSAEAAALKLGKEIELQYPKLKIEGPSPAFHPRENGKYKWQLIIKSPQRSALVAIVNNLPSGWAYNLDPTNLL